MNSLDAFLDSLALKCLRCGSQESVEMESSRTMYPFEGKEGSPEDPNRDIPLCRPCAKQHHEEWDDRWADYYSSVR